MVNRRPVQWRLSRGAAAAFWLLLLSCGGAGAEPGDAVRGREVFNAELANADAWSCIGCHPVQPGEPDSIGNNLSDIGARAGQMVAGMPAEEYLHTSILDPDSYLAGGYQEGIMYRGYRTALTPQQVNDLVAYMLTLDGGQTE